MSKLCSKCNLLYEDTVAFCPTCGTKLVSYSEKRFCPHCGYELASGWEFCPKCGEGKNVVSPVVTTYREESNNVDADSDNGSVISQKTLLIIIAFVVGGYFIIPGLFYFNVVIWGALWLGYSFVKKYWHERSFFKIVATVLCTLVVMGLFTALKVEHKRNVRNSVLNKYGTYR